MTNCISKPVLDSNGDFVWDGFKIVPIPGKGLGVVTTRAFGKRYIGHRLPYGGIVFNSANEHRYLVKNAGRRYASYQHGISDFILDGNEVEGEVVNWLDAHPRRYFPGMPTNAWIGSLVNEPSEEQCYNCHYEILTDTERLFCPDYEYINRDVIGVVVIDKVLNKGEELCISYYGNNSKRVYKRLGFQHIPSLTYWIEEDEDDGDDEEEEVDEKEENKVETITVVPLPVAAVYDRQELGRNLTAWNKANLLPNGKRRRIHKFSRVVKAK
jgi:hypothetical protein